LYNYGMRYYAPWMCRFVSCDPLKADYPHYTPYQYAGNKPINHVDIDGLEEDANGPPTTSSNEALGISSPVLPVDSWTPPVVDRLNKEVESINDSKALQTPELVNEPVPLFDTLGSQEGAGDDFNSGDNPPLSISKLLILNNDVNKSNQQLEDEFRSGIEFLAGAAGTESFNHFVQGSGKDLVHTESDQLVQLALENDSMNAVAAEAVSQFTSAIEQQIANGKLDIKALSMLINDNPTFQQFMLDGFGNAVSVNQPNSQLPLRAVIGGVQDLRIAMNSLRIDWESGKYEAVLEFRILDDFGLGVDDIYDPTGSTGLSQFWVLQRQRSIDGVNARYKPFVNVLVFQWSVSGTVWR